MFWGLVLKAIGPAILYPFLSSIPSLIRDFSVADETRDRIESQVLGYVTNVLDVEIYDFIIGKFPIQTGARMQYLQNYFGFLKWVQAQVEACWLIDSLRTSKCSSWRPVGNRIH